MPLPLLGLAALLAGGVGAASHKSAKEKNERAQEIANLSQRKYEEAKASLKETEKKTEESLYSLGLAKKNVLNNSINIFLTAYNRVKDIELSQSVGLNEVDYLAIDHEDALQLADVTKTCGSLLESSAAGAATGAIISLAASGALPMVASIASCAGPALAAGQFGMAVGSIGSAASFGLACTPLSAIVAPVVLFTGISATLKADENLEKARTMQVEADLAIEKMETSKVKCKAISEKSLMLESLLKNLDVMFLNCSRLLDEVTQNKLKTSSTGKIEVGQITEEEINLIAVTRSLAGAVKAVLDTPILDTNGTLSEKATTTYNEISKVIPKFQEKVDSIDIKKLSLQRRYRVSSREKKWDTTPLTNLIILLLVGWLVSQVVNLVFSTRFIGNVLGISTALLILNTPTNKSGKYVKNIACALLAIEFITAFVEYGPYFSTSIGGLILACLSVFGSSIIADKVKYCSDRISILLTRITISVFLGGCAVIFLGLLNLILGFIFPMKVLLIIVTIVYSFCAFVGAFFSELQ